MANVLGYKRVAAALRKQRREKPRKLRSAVIQCALLLEAESMEIVPVDTGNLKGSAFVKDESNIASGHISVLVGYEASYAIYVHEILDNWHAPGTYAKFLEWPARYLQPVMRDLIVEVMTT